MTFCGFGHQCPQYQAELQKNGPELPPGEDDKDPT